MFCIGICDDDEGLCGELEKCFMIMEKSIEFR